MAAPGNLFGSFLVAEMGRRLERAGFDEAIGLFGAMYAAPYLFAFASWLEDVRRRDGVRRLLLLTRDGHALLPVLRMIGSDAQIELMHSSRRMMYFATLEESFERTCAELAEGVQGSTPRAFLTGLETAGTARLLDAVGAVIGLDGKIETSEDVAAMTRALLACRAELLALAREERAGLCAYLEALNPGAEDTAIVDCGWALNTHRRLERLTGGPIRGYYVGTSDAAKAHRRIRSFLFAAKDGSTWHELHWRSAELLELPFIAAERRAVRMDASAPVPGVVLSTGNGGGEAVRAEIARRIHAEVAAFCAAAAPMRGWFDHQEAGSALLLLFTALTRHPTPFEYFTLAAIPHGRSVGEHEVRSVGEYWKCALAPDGGGGGAVHPLRRYLGLTLRSLRRDGLRMTAGRVRRKLRVVMRRRMPGAVGG
jgi:hypothetical protein